MRPYTVARRRLCLTLDSEDKLGEVFISYSWDDENHIRRVLDLSNRLRSDGIDCVLDQYETSPPEGWPRWMDKKIRDAQFVISICTETYYKRVMGEETSGKGLGVRWEGNLVYQHLYNAGATNAKFVPVVFDRMDGQFIPTPLQAATRYLLDAEDGYESLYSRLSNQPRVSKPKLGRRRPVRQKEVKTDFSLYVSAPIDPPLWDEARWRAVFVLVPKDGSRPPALGLAFQNEVPARQIFEQWSRRYGAIDRFDELRISIIEGDIPGERPGYSVHIGPDVKNTIARYKSAGLKVDENTFLMSVGRIHRMNPEPGSRNLEMFKEAYNRFNQFFLILGTINPDGSGLKPIMDFGLTKSSIQFRRVEDIGPDDEDSVVLQSARIESTPFQVRKGKKKPR